MCLNPKWIYKKGFYKQDNYRGSAGNFYELGTFSKCGCCEQCIAEKCNNWVVRNYYEEKAHEKKCFITLTYKENPILLVKKDLQDFIKRLRFNIQTKIRIFYAGEYGVLRNRPHFHIIIYGWEDENARYLGINKKGNIILKSDIIEKTWGLGRTSYQKFNSNEIPYITLYTTPQEEFKKAYKLNKEKLDRLLTYSKVHKNMTKKQKKNLTKEIFKLRKELEKSKKEYILVKEFNGWSIALGWSEFEKNYISQKEYSFTEYIEGCEFATPSPWVKKLANQGYVDAADEIFRRENIMIKQTDEFKEKMINTEKITRKRKKEITDWWEQKDKLEEI